MFRVVLSCEHAGNRIPAGYGASFESDRAREALISHRGWDPGALGIASRLASVLGAPLVAQDVSRLLVECNRSEHHAALWSEFSRALPAQDKARALDRYWRAHRSAVRRAIDEQPSDMAVVHVGIHTFTPVWKGRTRATDIGILFDPSRSGEQLVASRWAELLREHPLVRGLHVHRNRPYRGWTDGLTTTLRGELSAQRYLGFELEVSQAIAPLREEVVDAIAETLTAAAGRSTPPNAERRSKAPGSVPT